MQHLLGDPDDDNARKATADFFEAAFAHRPKLNESCTDNVRHEFLSTLVDTPEYKALNARTRLNQMAAEIAAVHFAKQYYELSQETEQEEQQEGTGEQTGDLPGNGGLPIQKVIRRVSEALEDAKQEVQQLEDEQGMAGFSPDGSGANSQLDIEHLAKFHHKIRNSSFLRRICELAGKYRRLAQSQQRRKTIHGKDQIVGIKYSDDIANIVPSELASLTDPDLEDDFMIRLAEKRIMCWDFKGVEPVAKGPIIVLCDESGSMTDDARIYHAKAIATTMAWIAQRQRRWCCLIGFSSSMGTPLVLPPRGWNTSTLLDWIGGFVQGGTSFEFLNNMEKIFAQTGAPRGKTDILNITDGVVSISDHAQKTFLKWKENNQCQMTTMLVGTSSRGDIDKISDKCYTLDRLAVNEKAIAEVFSV